LQSTFSFTCYLFLDRQTTWWARLW